MPGFQMRDTARPERGVFIDAGLIYRNYTDNEIVSLLSSVYSPDRIFIYWVGKKGNLVEKVHANSQARVMLAVSLSPHNGKKLLDLDDIAAQDSLLREVYAFAREQQYDGIYFDYEPVISGDPRLVRFMGMAREKMPGLEIGIYGFRIGIGSPGYSWDPGYFRSVLDKVDFATLSLYNFSSASESDYAAKVMSQVTQAGSMEKVFFIMPAYRASKVHDPDIENIRNCGKLLRGMNTIVFSTAYWTEGDRKSYAEFLG